MTQSTWTPVLEAQLKACIDKKMASGATAAQLSMTKNMVMGKAMRMGWQFQSMRKPSRNAVTQYPKRITIGPKFPYRPIKQPEPPPKIAEFLGLTMLELQPTSCRYPDESRPVLYCGQPCLDGKSWCPSHHRICYYPVTQMRRAVL